MKIPIEELKKQKKELEEKVKKEEEYRKLAKEVKNLKFKTTWFGRIKSVTSPKLRAMEKKVLPKIGKAFSNLGKNITAEWDKQEKKNSKQANKDGFITHL